MKLPLSDRSFNSPAIFDMTLINDKSEKRRIKTEWLCISSCSFMSDVGFQLCKYSALYKPMFHREKAGQLIVATFPYSLWFCLSGLRTAYRDYTQTFSFHKREGEYQSMFGSADRQVGKTLERTGGMADKADGVWLVLQGMDIMRVFTQHERLRGAVCSFAQTGVS
jgi:hypothetical protein